MTPPAGSIARVGIVAKSHLREAAPHLTEIAAWLEARGISPVFETATAALMTAGSHRRGAIEHSNPRRQLRQPRLSHRSHPARALLDARGRGPWTGARRRAPDA